MAGMHHTSEPKSSTSSAHDVQTDRVNENLKDLSISSSTKKKVGGTKKRKQTTPPNTYKTKDKEIQRPLSQASCRSKRSGSESGSATSPAGSSHPSGEHIGETIAAAKYSDPSEPRKVLGPETRFPSNVQRKQSQKASKKEFKFEAYIPLCEVQQSLKKGELIEGVLRINPRNYEDAYISAPDGLMDIYIGGILDRNRALNGDVVAVMLKEPKDWKILWDDLKDYEMKHSLKLFSDTENDERIFPDLIQLSNVREGVDPNSEHCDSLNSTANVKNDVKPMDTFEIGVFNELSVKGEERQFNGRKKRKNRNRKNRLRKHAKEYLDEQEVKCISVTLDSDVKKDATSNCSDAIPKESKEDLHIPSKSTSDRNSYSSTSFNDSVNNSQYKQQSIKNEEFTITADSSKEIENTAKNLKDVEWTNESCLEGNKLIMIPDDIPQFACCDDVFTTETTNDTVIEEDNHSEELFTVPVEPDKLSGDEFSLSDSGDSTCHQKIEQLQEDRAFFSNEQDTLNNNPAADLVYDMTELHPVEYQVNESEANSHSVLTEIQCTENKSFIEEIKSSDTNLGACTLTSNSNSINIIMPHNVTVPSSETESKMVTNEDGSGKENNDCKTGQVCTEPLSTPFKQVNSDTYNNAEKSPKKERKAKRKEQFSKLKRQKSSEEKQKIAYLTELMKYPWGVQFIQRTAKVVHILEKKHTRMAAGCLKLLQNDNSKWALFSPFDHKLPRIFIPLRECPPGFLLRPKDFSNYMFLAKIEEWTEDSKFAKGTLIQKLGEVGEIEAETSGILLENGIDTDNFDEDTLKDLPQESNWSIPLDEVQARRDFRNECVFTIDPSTARDLDDAVSCNELEDGLFEIGVHIADVTYFVKEDTALDSVASKRATSVYLVQNVVPMLPHTLCERLCSLNPGEDRLSFSVVWKVTTEGDIVDEWFGRSVISSCVKLSYEDAQVMIENPQKQWDTNDFPHISGKFTKEDIVKRVIKLNTIAQQLREKRFKKGALRLDQVKLQFCLDRESGMPSGFSIYEHRDSNRLIEEFMLLANMAVAHRIYKSFPDQALLRCHPPPERKLMNDVLTLCEGMGIKLDASTSGTLQASLAALVDSDDIYSKARSQVLTSLCSKPMKCALYFSSGGINDSSDCHHYALNVPLYTHFTSPIRRYPDIIVHRLLAASLDNTPATYTSKLLKKLANHCNDKKYTAKRVNELSSELFLTAFIRQCGPMEEQAMVMSVMDHSFDVLVLRIGLVKRVYCDKLNLKSKCYAKEKGAPYLLLNWNEGAEFIQEIRIFTLVMVSLSVQTDEPMKINVVLKYPDTLEDSQLSS